jgi:hypothetical protein
MAKCVGCSNPADPSDHHRAPLCVPCLEAWREFEDSPRITQPLHANVEASYLEVEKAVLAELDRQLEANRPELARKIRRILSEIDRMSDEQWLTGGFEKVSKRFPLSVDEAFFAGVAVGRISERAGVRA